MATLNDMEFQIGRLHLRKGDILAVKVHDPIHEEFRIALLKSLREILDRAGHPGVQTMFVDHDIDIGLILFESISQKHN